MSKRLIKLANALQQKKYRKEYQSFIVEGEKSVLEVLRSNFEVKSLLATEKFLAENNVLCQKIHDKAQVSEDDLLKAGSFQTNSAALAIVTMPDEAEFVKKEGLVLLLDQIKDPGNLGTIIRLADWYGVKEIVCSPDSVDAYNPKTVAATMGSFLRVSVYYEEISKVLQGNSLSFGAFLGGQSIYNTQFPKDCFIVIGNESHGISKENSLFISQKITIPCFGGAESLNAGMATAIFLDNYCRQNLADIS